MENNGNAYVFHKLTDFIKQVCIINGININVNLPVPHDQIITQMAPFTNID